MKSIGLQFFLLLAVLCTSLCVSAFEVAAPAAPVQLDPESVERLRQQVEEAYVSADLSALSIPAAMGLVDGLHLAEVRAAGLTAPATGSISTNFFNRVLAQVTAVINQVGKTTVIPGGSGSNFGYNEIRFSQFSVDSITFKTEAPNRLILTVNKLTIVIPDTGFNVHAKVLLVKVKCSGKFSAQVVGATISIALTLGNDGKGHITAAAAASASFQKVTIKHSFNGVVCKVANSIVNALIGNIDKKIGDAIKTQVPKAIGPATTQAMQAALRQIPLYFTGTPSVSSGGFSVTVDLLATASVSAAPTADKTALVLHSSALTADYSRDISVSVPQTSINNIMSAAFVSKKFYYKLYINKATQDTSIFKVAMPNVYQACPDCQIVMIFDIATTAPSVVFSGSNVMSNVNNITLSFLGKNNNGVEVPLFVVKADIVAGVNGLTIRTVGGLDNMYFQVAMQQFKFVTQSSSVGPLPALDIMYPIISFCVKDLAIPTFNGNFQGLSFPAMMTNGIVTSATGVFEFATDIVLSA